MMANEADADAINNMNKLVIIIQFKPSRLFSLLEA